MVERDGFGESTCLRTGFPIIGPRAALLRRFINVSQMCWRSEEAQSRMPSLVDSVKGGREGMRGLSTEEKINVRHDINAVSLTQMLRASIIYHNRLDTSKMIRWTIRE